MYRTEAEKNKEERHDNPLSGPSTLNLKKC